MDIAFEPTIAQDLAHSWNGWSPGLDWYFSRAYWREVARRLDQFQGQQINEMLEIALDYITAALADPQRCGQHFYLSRWKQVLMQDGLTGAVMILTDPTDDDAQALRTNSPFRRVLSSRERNVLFSTVEKRFKEEQAKKKEGEL